ncbi:MAG: DivIVA domain-containing protein [Cytophagales bacterium]|nr:DivIVA domain-containing protein [Cytophagales bacterium]
MKWVNKWFIFILLVENVIGMVKKSGMRITPLEIRQKTFEKTFRGYEKEEVEAYLISVSQEWEKLLEENREQKMKIELLDKEVQKLRDVETSLYKTLKTAEDTGSHLVEQANKTAELLLKEAQMNADALLNEAKYQAKDTIEKAEQQLKISEETSKDMMRHAEREVKEIENIKENLILELKNIQRDLQERISRIDNKPTTPSKNLEKTEAKKSISEAQNVPEISFFDKI